jgi:hypothetical protein
MKLENHEDSYKEHREAIFRFALDILGIEKSQRIIGLHASRGILDLLSIHLLKKNKISEGMQLNHRWFKSSKVADRLPEFTNKKSIVGKIVALERLCEKLTYGAKKPTSDIEQAITLFKDLENEIHKLNNEKK